MDNEDVELDLGGEGEFDLLGDCRLEWEVRDEFEFRENWREDVVKGTDR